MMILYTSFSSKTETLIYKNTQLVIVKQMTDEKIKIVCHSCYGTGTVLELAYPSRKSISVPCPECNGEKWVYA